MTDDRLPPPEPDDGHPDDGEHPSSAAESNRPASAQNGPARPGSAGHPGTLELSAYLDRELTGREASVVLSHLTTCLPCRAEVERLRSARVLLLAGGQPSAPPGAMESAVVVALDSVPRTLRPPAPGDAAPGDAAPGNVAPWDVAPWDVTGGTVAPDVASDPGSGVGEPTLPEEPASGTDGLAGARAAGRPSRAPWTADRVDVGASTQPAIRRHRRPRIAVLIAAAVIVVALIGGGTWAAVGSHKSSPTVSPGPVTSVTLPAGGIDNGTNGTANSTPTTAPTHSAALPQPPVGVLSLQLRSEAASAPCSEKTPVKVVFKDGSLQEVNPPPTKPAVVEVPGVADECVSVGTAFATAWNSDVKDVSVQAITGPGAPASTASGAPVNLVFLVEPAGVEDEATMSLALDDKVTVVVVGQGEDLGVAVITKGPFVTLTVSPLIATFMREQLLPLRRS